MLGLKGEVNGKMLIPVPEVTRKSLGFLSIDPAGTFQFEGNRWIRIYSTKDDVSMKDLIGQIKNKIKITKEYGKGILYITLTVYGANFEEVIHKFSIDEALIREKIRMQLLSVDDVLQIVTGDEKISYVSIVRGKRDLLSKLPKITEKSNYFLLNGAYGECSFILQFPFFRLGEFSKKLEEIGCQITTCIEAENLNAGDSTDFNKALETRYNRRTGQESARSEFINISFEMMLICDSLDAMDIVDETIFSIFTKEEYILVPAYGMQKNQALAMISLGIIDHSNMRNMIWQC